MRIGIDGRFALGERRGIGNYSLALLRTLSSAHPDCEFLVFIDRPDSAGIFSSMSNCSTYVIKPRLYPLWEQLALPKALRALRPDLFHALGNTAPLGLPASIRLVMTVHDVMYLKSRTELPDSPSLYHRLGRRYRCWNVPRAMAGADAILTVSEYSKADILATVPGLEPERITVTYQGLPPHMSGREAERPGPGPHGKRYLLHLGGLDPRKNTGFVVRNCLSLRRAGKCDADLVILGLKGLQGLGLTPEEVAGAGPWVHLPGFVPEAALPGYFRKAEMLLFPSKSEGFGIPLLEAMAQGTPIITSRVTSLPEIAGQAALVVDPGQDSEFQAAVQSLLASRELRSRLSDAGRERIQQFNWETTGRLTMGAYFQALEGPSKRQKP